MDLLPTNSKRTALIDTRIEPLTLRTKATRLLSLAVGLKKCPRQWKEINAFQGWLKRSESEIREGREIERESPSRFHDRVMLNFDCNFDAIPIESFTTTPRAIERAQNFFSFELEIYDLLTRRYDFLSSAMLSTDSSR
jgi:hypothetical protein